MGTYVVIGIYLLASLLALSKPRFAILLFWPLLYAYPDWLLFGKLPLNAGLDDVFIIFLFIGSYIKSGGKLQVKWPLIMVSVFWVILVLGDMTSVITLGLGIIDLLPRWLKSLGLILFVYSVSTMITTPKQIQRAIYSLIFGALLGGISIIYYTIYPNAYNPFEIPLSVRGLGWWAKQSIGAFGDTAVAGGVLGFAILIGYFYIRLAKDRFKRPIILVVTGILFFSLILSTGRSGWLFVLSAVVVSTLLSKQKGFGILLLGAIAIGVAVTYTHFAVFSRRIALTSLQMGGGIESITSNRWQIWLEHLKHAKVSWLFCGQGFTMMKGAHAHSNYVGILMNTGLAGVVFWIIYYVKVIRKARWLKKSDTNPRMAILFHAVFWCYIGYFAYFIVSTPVQWPNVRYIDFFLMTLVCVRYKQLEEQEQGYEQDELEGDYYEDQLEDESTYQDLPTETQLYYDY